jgi:indole-3-glycerol phosphate synthase
MSILDKIIAQKLKEVEHRKQLVSVSELEKREFFPRTCLSLRESLLQPAASGIIAEIKRRSPSQGIIQQDVSVERLSTGYAKAGASGLSVLTDKEFFGGSDEDLMLARSLNDIPVLRKEFIVDDYQVVESKAIGADVILLIAAVLTPLQIRQYTATAHALGLEVLLEVHNESELLQNPESGADMIGVNNRDLKTFEVSIEASLRLVEKIPTGMVKVSESGIDAVDTVLELKAGGYDGFLMGQSFMKNERPEIACEQFIRELDRKRRSITNNIP